MSGENQSAAAGGVAIRGGAAMLASTGGRQVLRLGITILLARLLTPEDFGIAAIITAVFSVGLVFQDFGLSAATVQRENITAAAVGTLFWINAATGLVLTLIFIALAPLLANYFERPELAALCQVMSFTFVLNGFTVQHRAMLQREFRFGTQAKITVLSAALGGIAALLLAWQGGRYWALAAQLLVSDVLILWLTLRAVSLKPVRPVWTTEVREMLNFGISMFGFQLLGAFAQNLYVSMLGRVHGASAVGLYTRGLALAMIPQSLLFGAASHVAMARLSRLNEWPVTYTRFYLQNVQLLALASAPVALLFALYGDLIAHVIYGAGWDDVAGLLRIFAWSLLPAPILHSTGTVFVSRGDSRGMLRWGVVGWCIMGACTVIGARWGITGAAWGYSLCMYISFFPCLLYTYRGTSITIAAVLRSARDPYLTALLMVPVGLGTRTLLEGLNPWILLPLCSTVVGLAYLAGCWFLTGQKELMQRVGSQLLRRNKSQTAE